MSKLQELIKELCPEGVEFRKLWNVTIWDKKFNSVDKSKQPKVISYPYLLAKELFLLEKCNGNVFLLSTGEQTGWTTEELAGDYLCVGEVVTIPWGKSRKVSEVMKYYKGKFVTADNRIATSNDTSILSNKYLYYWLLTQSDNIDKCYRGAGIQHPDMSKILDFEIPLPPLEVQNEIVRILDTFTSHTAELQAELQARKEQYEYYKKKIFGHCAEHNRLFLLRDVASFSQGLQVEPQLQYSEMQPGRIRFLRIIDFVSEDEPFRYIDRPNNKYIKNDEELVMLRYGASAAGKVFMSYSGAIANNIFKINLSEEILPRYAMYYLSQRCIYEMLNSSGGKSTMPAINFKIVGQIQIPVPSLSEQQRIVSILDKFESLVNDLSEGLPAEIAAVQEQYEYYRNKLLAFKRIS